MSERSIQRSFVNPKPALLGLLLDCATRPDQTLAAISMGALVRLAEVGGHQFNEQDWTTLPDSFRDACYTTQPLQLLNPESMLTFRADYVSGPRKLSVNTSPLREAQIPSRQSEAHIEHPDSHDNGTVEGTPGSNGDTSKNRRIRFDSPVDDLLERLSHFNKCYLFCHSLSTASWNFISNSKLIIHKFSCVNVHP